MFNVFSSSFIKTLSRAKAAFASLGVGTILSLGQEIIICKGSMISRFFSRSDESLALCLSAVSPGCISRLSILQYYPLKDEY